ncbi:MAG: hypothetical protein IJP21_05365 [Clostridia bacterium]|nr:hypothetical protein [Clostridia bacterium]
MSKKILFVILSLVLALSLVGCTNNPDMLSVAFNEDISSEAPSDTLIAQNENYKLEIDTQKYGVVLTDLKTGKVWNTIPKQEGPPKLDALGLPIGNHVQVDSTLLISYIDGASKNETVSQSYTSAVLGGRIRTAKGEEGVIVEYYFDDAKIMIPVEFILHDDSFELKIDPKKIQETDSQITAISVAPFFCSAENDVEDAYLFYPSGSGALVDNASVSPQGYKYTSEVYGRDLSNEQTTILTKGRDVKLPVFGAKSGATSGVCGVITEGEESASIDAVSGSTTFGRSAVYPTFYLRSYIVFKGKTGSSKAKNVYATYKLSSPLSVRYYPLSDEKANYSGMAEAYRSYLTKTGKMPTLTEDVNLNLTLVGGELVPKSFLGVPYSDLFAATTLNDAYNITNEITSEVNGKTSVKLKGFTASGIDVGGVGGGYVINENLGKVDDFKKFKDFCDSKSVGLYFDFELTKFNGSSNGFSDFRDAVYNSGEIKTSNYNYNIATGLNEKSTRYNLLTPRKFVEATQKILDKTSGWNLDGVSLESLSQVSYSDYADDNSSDYYAKSYFGDRVTDSFKLLKDNGKKVMSSNANQAAAIVSDVVVEAPLASSKANIFYEDVPFYSMVFKGSVGLTGESVNLATNTRKAVLQSVEAGYGLNYTVINNWENSLITCYSPIFFNSKYADIKDDILANQAELSDYYGKIAGAKISAHNILAAGVRETVFDNGVHVIVNYNNTPVATAVGEVAAEGFVVWEAAV